MRAVTKILAGGVVAAALFGAAPAAAQYYPGYGYPGYGGNPIGQVLNQVLGNGYGYNGYGGGYGANSQVVVNQCVSAVQARLNGGYGGYASPYGYGNANGYGGARVLGVSRVEPRSGGVTVRGVANSGRYAGANAYGGQAQVDLTWKCKSDNRGYVYDVEVRPAQSNYGQAYPGYQGYQGYPNAAPYTGGAYDYSQYGYQRY
jgi:hypothetical protein